MPSLFSPALWLLFAASVACQPPGSAATPLPDDNPIGTTVSGDPDAPQGGDGPTGPTSPGGDSSCPSCPPPDPYPSPGAFPSRSGPGLGKVHFAEADLFEHCAYLDGGPDDETDHHNLVTLYDGYLLMPFAPEFGGCGGLAFFDVSDPCNPVRVSTAGEDTMRESHSIGFSHEGGAFAVVDSIGGSGICLPPISGLPGGGNITTEGGIQFWDISDITQPSVVGNLYFDDFLYPDAYARVILSVFWQGHTVYVGGADNGVFIVDAEDPTTPRLVTQYKISPTVRVGQVQAVGNILVVSAAEGPRIVLLDITDPYAPQPIPGGDISAKDPQNYVIESYFSNLSGSQILLARKNRDGGLAIFELGNPSAPTFVGIHPTGGNGGYVFAQNGYAFMGESTFATVYDIRDPSNIGEVVRLDLEGDLDTATPLGNLVVLAVDDQAEPGHGSALVPWQTAPDSVGPSPGWTVPKDGATQVPRGSRIGVSFDEAIDVSTVWYGSVRLYKGTTPTSAGIVEGILNTQESIINFTPRTALAANTVYTFSIPVGGVRDFSGNPLPSALSIQFTTGSF